ncbi:MAG: hypothetical protein SFX18_12555 [Pirellulales bacterium]|nr:hypothetical protein [Pirellulales bacterium]
MAALRSVWALVCVCLLIGLSGCGGKPADGSSELRGKLLLQGKPIEVAGRQVGIGRVILRFIPVDAGVEPVQTDVAADGTFLINAGIGNGQGGIKPGKYKISVVADESGKDKLQGAYTPEKTTIVKDILADGQELVIELKP